MTAERKLLTDRAGVAMQLALLLLAISLAAATANARNSNPGGDGLSTSCRSMVDSSAVDAPARSSEGREPGCSARLGAALSVGPLQDIGTAAVSAIHEAVRMHGMVVFKNQALSRAEQVALTDVLGETIILPRSFEGQDPNVDATDLSPRAS